MEEESALSGANVGTIWCECRHYLVRTVFISALFNRNFRKNFSLTILTILTARSAPPVGGPACYSKD
jgi:hypothetical protein